MDGSRATQLKPIFFSHGMRIGSLPHIPYFMAVSPIYLSPTMRTLHRLKFSTATTHSQDNFICPRWSGNHTTEWLQNMCKSFSIPPWGLSGLSIITRVDLGLARGDHQGHRRIGIWILEEKALLLCLSYSFDVGWLKTISLWWLLLGARLPGPWCPDTGGNIILSILMRLILK